MFSSETLSEPHIVIEQQDSLGFRKITILFTSFRMTAKISVLSAICKTKTTLIKIKLLPKHPQQAVLLFSKLIYYHRSNLSCFLTPNFHCLYWYSYLFGWTSGNSLELDNVLIKNTGKRMTMKTKAEEGGRDKKERGVNGEKK